MWRDLRRAANDPKQTVAEITSAGGLLIPWSRVRKHYFGAANLSQPISVISDK
jgi:hypothetical protein